MTTANGNRSSEAALPTTHAAAAAARCLARVVVGSFSTCEDSGVPLSQLQRVAIVEAALLEFDGFGDHLSSLATVQQLLRDLTPPAPPSTV